MLYDDAAVFETDVANRRKPNPAAGPSALYLLLICLMAPGCREPKVVDGLVLLGQKSGNPTVFSIGESGSLTRTSQTLDTAWAFGQNVRVHPSGRFMVVANSQSVRFIAISHPSLRLDVRNPKGLPKDFDSVAFSQDGRTLWTTQASSHLLRTFSFNARSGAVKQEKPAVSVPSIKLVGSDPFGQYLFGMKHPDSSIVAIKLSVAGLGSPGDSGTEQIEQTTLRLAGIDGNSHWILHPEGHWLYVLEYGWQSAVRAYGFDRDTATLKPVEGIRFAAEGHSADLAIHPDGSLLCVANGSTDNISAYRIDRRTGGLWPVPGSPFSTGKSPSSLAFDLSGRYLYVASNGERAIRTHAVDLVSGALGSAETAVDSSEDAAISMVTLGAPRTPEQIGAIALSPDSVNPAAMGDRRVSRLSSWPITPDQAVAQLQDRDWRVRCEAVRALRNQRVTNGAAAVALVNAVRDENDSVSADAIQAVTALNIAAELVVPAALEQLAIPQRRANWDLYLRALARAGTASRSALPVIFRMVREESGEIKLAAVRALGNVEELDVEVVELLLETALGAEHTEYKAAEAAVAALRRVSPLPERELPRLERALSHRQIIVRRSAAVLLGWMGPAAGRAVPALLSRLDDEAPMVRDAAVVALAQIRGNSSAPSSPR